MRRSAFVIIFALTALSAAIAADNVLTEKEKQDGWILLFDGQTTKG